jgi:Protein of unknown function (DUF2459)
MSSARSVGVSALAAAALFMVLSAAAQTLRPASPGDVAASPAVRGHASAAIYVARRGWHIDIGFAAGELRAPLNSLAAKLPEARYLFFGFGDRRYLMVKRHNMLTMLEALWPGKGLILVTGLVASPAEAFGMAHVVELRISPEQSAAAQDFIWQSLIKTQSSDAGPIDAAAPGPYEGSLYFSARAKYSAIHTCNTWAAEVLDKTDLPVHPAGVMFAGQVWNQTRKLAAAE